eukprot:gene18017-biopygen12932
MSILASKTSQKWLEASTAVTGIHPLAPNGSHRWKQDVFSGVRPIGADSALQRAAQKHIFRRVTAELAAQKHILPDLHARACKSTYCGTCNPRLAKAHMATLCTRVCKSRYLVPRGRAPLKCNSRYRAPGV